VSVSLLVEAYQKLPQPQPGDDPDLAEAGLQEPMREFRAEVLAKYTEGTLQRLLQSEDDQSRRAAALALGLVGTMKSNRALATALRDADPVVRHHAGDGLWELWFRGDTVELGVQLQEALRLPDQQQVLAALDDLIRHAPDFAEAYNQRAIVHFRRGEYSKTVTDCERTLRLNPVHFGAASGMGQSFLRMNKPRAALRAFQRALDINPHLDDLRDTVRDLQAALGLGDGSRESE
jgi:tetratricopeptide (TPR) repeat protein